jgi:hypothetical protein
MTPTLRNLLGVLLVAASPIALAAPPHTGIQGQSFHYIAYGLPYMIAPGIWIGIPSVQLPVATSFTVVSAHNGREIARVGTDANGFYSLSLPPGKYLLVPDTLVVNAFFNCTVSTGPIEVEVRAKQFTLLNIFYFSQGPPCTFTGGPAPTEE